MTDVSEIVDYINNCPPTGKVKLKKRNPDIAIDFLNDDRIRSKNFIIFLENNVEKHTLLKQKLGHLPNVRIIYTDKGSLEEYFNLYMTPDVCAKIDVILFVHCIEKGLLNLIVTNRKHVLPQSTVIADLFRRKKIQQSDQDTDTLREPLLSK